MTTNANGSPWWSKSVWQMGPLAVIAMVLILVEIGVIPSTKMAVLSEVKAGVVTMQAALDAHAAEGREHTKLLRTLCVNSAKNEEQVRRCLE